jgi:hypothetical protein
VKRRAWIGLVAAVALLGFLYYRPVQAYLKAQDTLQQRAHEVKSLARENARLSRRLRLDESGATLVREARKLGLVRALQLFIVKGIGGRGRGGRRRRETRPSPDGAERIAPTSSGRSAGRRGVRRVAVRCPFGRPAVWCCRTTTRQAHTRRRTAWRARARSPYGRRGWRGGGWAARADPERQPRARDGLRRRPRQMPAGG